MASNFQQIPIDLTNPTAQVPTDQQQQQQPAQAQAPQNREAQFPDGTILSFPPDTTDEVFYRTVRQYAAQVKASQPPVAPWERPTAISRLGEGLIGQTHPGSATSYAAQQWMARPQQLLPQLIEGLKTGEAGGPVALAKNLMHPVEFVKSQLMLPQVSEDYANRRWDALAADIAVVALNAWLMYPEKGELNRSLADTLAGKKGFADASNVLHQGGLGAQKEIVKAVKAVDKEVGSAAQSIADESVRRDPRGTIEAAPIQNDIEKGVLAYTQNVRKMPPDVAKALGTPPLPPALVQVAMQSSASTGFWSWGEAQALRTEVGRALENAEGPERGALTEAYKKLSVALEDQARDYGLINEWNDYNAEHKNLMGLMKGPLGTIMDARDGTTVNRALTSDLGATKEMIRGLSKYGLDADEVSDWVRNIGRANVGKSDTLGGLVRRNVPFYIAGGIIAKFLGWNWYWGAAPFGFGVPMLIRLRGRINLSRHPFAAEGGKLLLGRELQGPKPRSTPTPFTPPGGGGVTPPTPPTPATVPPVPPVATPAATPRGIFPRLPIPLPSMRPNLPPPAPQSQPGAGAAGTPPSAMGQNMEQSAVDALLEILQDVPPADRKALANELLRQMGRAAERAQAKRRMTQSMQQA